MLYFIRVNKTKQYIQYVDDCWYDTAMYPVPFFTYEQAVKAVARLMKHYIYDVTIVGDKTEHYKNGVLVTTNVETEIEVKPIKMETTTIKKNVFKIKMKI